MINFPVKRIFLAVLLGLIGSTIYLIKQEQLFKAYLYRKICPVIEQNLGCRVNFELSQINLINPKLICKSVQINPPNLQDQSWNWQCQELHFGWSWWALIARRSLEITINIEQIKLVSNYHQNKLAIWPHLQKLIFTTSPVPVLLSELQIKSGQLEIHNSNQTKPIILNWSSNTKEIDSDLKSNIYIQGGQVPLTNQYCLQDLQGNWQLNLPTKGNLQKLQFISTSQFTIPTLSASETYFANFKWADLQGLGELKSISGKLNIQSISFALEDQIWRGEINGNTNLTTPGNFQVSGQIKANNQAKGKFNFTAGQLQSQGSWSIKNKKLNLSGQLQNHGESILNYQALLQNHPPYLQNLTIKNQTKAIISQINCNKNRPQELLAIVWLDRLMPLLPKKVNQQLIGKGELHIASQINSDQIRCHYQLKSGQLIVSKLQIPINYLEGQMSWNQRTKTVTLQETIASLHQGQIKIPQAKLSYLNTNQTIQIHIPVIFEKCAINIKPGLGAICSGQLLWQTNSDGVPKLSGFTIIEQARYSGNLWDWPHKINGSIKNQPLQIDPLLDLMIFSRMPIQIKSDTLKAQTHLQMQLTGTLSKPQFTGYLHSSEGQIYLPYKPLLIEHGTLYLNGDLSNTPTIDLVASTQIKQFNINVHVNGPVKPEPPIAFESNPPLSDEQIAALLLTGSESTSLNMVMPALVLQNLNLAIFGNPENLASEHPFIKQLLKPFEHIRFIPSFSDETGRGGLRGIIEINVSDRLRASFQKNFSLTEDSQIEVDYALTDDISLRGIKDERGDLGGEIELKFRA